MSSREAIAYVPAEKTARLVPYEDPDAPGPHEVLVRTSRVGFCGTDREIVRGGIAVLPAGATRLVLGHEMVGVVAEAGAQVEGVRAGDVVVIAVRRACGRCAPCKHDRPDFCLSGDYLEHGITQLDGFARPSLVVPETSLVLAPSEIGPLAVLAEPLSIAEKAIDQAKGALCRIPGLVSEGPRWGAGLEALVAGAGTIGLLAAHLLVERGFEVEVVDVLEPEALAPGLATAAGAAYRRVDRERPEDAASGGANVIVEAAGDARLAFELMRALAPGGVLVWLGVPDAERTAELEVGRLMLTAVLRHHAVVATINSSREHMQRAIDDLSVLAEKPRFGELITGVLPPERFEDAVWPPSEAIKQVVEYDGRI